MVDVESEGGVTRIFLNRPEKVNALTSDHLRELEAAFRALAQAPDVRVVVLGGRGKALCGGADVKEMSELTAEKAGRFRQKSLALCATFPKAAATVGSRRH